MTSTTMPRDFYRGTLALYLEHCKARITNLLQKKTQARRKAQKALGCPHLGCSYYGAGHKDLVIESAHWPKGIEQIIYEALWPRFKAADDDQLIEGSLTAMREAILAAHEPLDEVYRFVCTDCHQTHYRTSAGTGTGAAGQEQPRGQVARGREKLIDILEESWPRSVSTDQLIIRSGLMDQREFYKADKLFRARKNIASKIYHLKKDGFDVGSDGTGNYWGRRKAT